MQKRRIVVLPNRQDIKYIKRNEVRLKTGKSEEFKKILLQFVRSLEGKVKGLKGFIIMNSINNANEVIVISLWETEPDMEVFYHPSNKALNEFVDRASSLFESKPQRTDYVVSFFGV
jgi:heme-degrading monooxygenase HmoA